MKDIEDIVKHIDISSIYGVNEDEQKFLCAYKDKLMMLRNRLEKRGRAYVSIKNPIFRNKKLLTNFDNIVISGLIILTSLLVYFLIPSNTWVDASHIVKIRFS